MVSDRMRMRLHKIVLRSLSLACILFTALPVSLGFARLEEQSSPITLQQAIADGLVSAIGVPLERGMKQPNLDLTITSPIGSDISVEIVAGTVFASNDPNFATLVVAEAQVVEGPSPAKAKLATFSMQSDKTYPSKWTPTEYGYSVVLDDNRLLNLMQTARDKGYGTGYEMQLAVWMTLENKSLAEIISPMKTKPTERELEMAQCIFDGGNCSVVQPPTLTPPVTITREEPNQPPVTQEPLEEPVKKGGMTGTIILIVFVAAAIIVGTFIFFGKRKKVDATPEEPVTSWDWESQGRRQSEEKPTPSLPPKPGPMPTPPPPVKREPTRPMSTLTLKVESGPLRSRDITGTLPFILSRDELEVVVIPETTISAPHALLFLGEDKVEVKDMNSSNGVVANGSKLESDWHALDIGTIIKFGRAEIEISGSKFEVVSGEAVGNSFGPFSDTVVISRESVNVVSLGEQDGKISSAHVLFSLVDDQIQVRDLDSRYGTWINGQEATRNQILRPGDRIQLGSTIFIYQID